MRTNFTECAIRYSANTSEGQSLRSQWGWHGPLLGLERNESTQISREGCKSLCGTGIDAYPWNDASNTITTWILPVVGTLLQAPFESNAFKRTVWAITRWVGSPIASLSYVLWNIKVSAKAALMVDMAVRYDETPERRSHFGSMRDSMYLLLAMTQYTMNPAAIKREKEAEGLLRIALFSKDLKLTDTNQKLRHMRRILARELREMRRRGVVPVFVSTLWFLFAFALSIQAAFGDVGENRTAHDLALGCLLAWFPILIMGSIVDRNPIAADAIKKKLNALVDHVRHALRDPRHREAFLESFADQPQKEYERLKEWVQDIAEKSEYMEDFFIDFAGQGRVRWHYGAAHPILSDIENCYIADRGRNWIYYEAEARMNLVLGTVNAEGLVWFDIREFWQIASAIIIVAASCGGGFILSYFTPTVGLGCRSGGYTIFFSIALGLLIMEMTVWFLLSPYEVEEPNWLATTSSRLQRSATFQRVDEMAHGTWAKLKRRTSSVLNMTGDWLIRTVVWIALLFPWKDKDAEAARVDAACNRVMNRLRSMSPQKRWEFFFFRPVETFNTIWLIYIVMAQTFGWYKTCDCVTSYWGGGGGYLDFSQQDTTNNKWVQYYWVAGTVVTASMMALAMFYITVEWSQQSWLSTEDYDNAMEGLKTARRYRHWTYAFRWISRKLTQVTLDPIEKLAVWVGIIKKPQKTLLWTKSYEWGPDHPDRPTAPISAATSRHRTNPSIELTEYTSPMVRDGSHDSQQAGETPAMATSLFPPAISTRRRPQNTYESVLRSDSQRLSEDFAAAQQFLSRTSDESPTAPLIRRPGQAHRHDHLELARSATVDDERRRSSDEIGYPVSPPAMAHSSLSPFFASDADVHVRQGYARANSDAASSPPEGGLGIRFDSRDAEAGSSSHT